MKKLLILFCFILTAISVNAQTVQKQIIATYISNSNVFVKYADKSKKQLTFANADSFPMILKRENAILFIRDAAGDYNYPKIKKIMKVNCSSLIEKTITDKKPFQDAVSNTYHILNIQNPTLSADQTHIYFSTECYMTGNELVKVDLSTGKWSKIFPANDFELIKGGQFKGLFLIGRSEMKGSGARSIYYYLVNEKNETLKEFDSADNYRAFKKSVIKN